MRLTRKLPFVLAIFLCSATAAITASAAAADINWTNPLGGDFTTGANWAGGSSPAPADNAVFNLADFFAYTVTIPNAANLPINQLQVGTDQVTLDFTNDGISPSALTLSAAANSLVVGAAPGDNAQLTIIADNLTSPNIPVGLIANDGIIADQAGSSGALTIIQTNTPPPSTIDFPLPAPVVALSGTLIVGNAGSGVLNVNSGVPTFVIPNPLPGLASGSTIIANQAGSTGVVTIGDTATNITGVWNVNGNASIAAQPGAHGTVTVDNGQWNVSGDINVGGAEPDSTGTPAPGGVATVNVNLNGDINVPPYTSAYIDPNNTSTLRLYAGGTVNLNGGAITINALQSRGGTFNFASGSLAVGSDLDIGAPTDAIKNDLILNADDTLLVNGNLNIDTHQLQINGGGVAVLSATVSNGGGIQLNSGTLDLDNSDLTIGAGDLIGANVNITSTTRLDISGQTTIDPGASLNVSGGSFSTTNVIANGAFSFTAGTLALDSGLTVGPGQLLGDNIVLGPSQTLFVHTTVIDAGSKLTIAGGALNAGTISGSGQLVITSGTLSTVGDITVGTGGLLGANVTVPKGESLTVYGQTTVSSGSTLAISGGTFRTGILIGNENVTFTSGALAISQGLEIGAGQPLGPTVILGANQSLAVGNTTTIDPNGLLAIGAGTFTASTLIINGSLSATSGTFLDQTGGGLTLGGVAPSGSTITLGPTAKGFVTGSTTINPGSLGSISGGTLNTDSLNLGPNSTFNITNQAAVNVTNQTMIAAGAILNISGGSLTTNTLDATGQISFTAGALSIASLDLTIGPGELFGPNLALAANQILKIGGATTVDANQTFTLNGATYSTSALDIGTGSTLALSQGANLTVKGDLMFDLASIVHIDSAAVNVSGQTTISSGVNASFTGASLSTSTLQIGSNSSVTLAANSSLTVKGLATIASGGVVNVSGGEFTAGQLSSTGGLTFSSGRLAIGSDLTLDANGPLGPTLAIPSGSSLYVGTLTVGDTGTGSVTAAGSAFVQPTNLSIAAHPGSTGSVVAGGLWDVLSKVVVSGRWDAATQSALPGGVGSLTIAAGGQFGTGDSITVLPKSSLQVNGQLFPGNSVFITHGATLSGHGYIQLGDELINDGIIAPTPSVTPLAFFGIYVQNPDGELSILLGGERPSLDGELDLGTDTTLGGLLAVTFYNSFTSTTGDIFDIVHTDFAQFSGAFTNAPDDAALDISGRMLEVNYSTTDVTLTDIGPAVPEPATTALLLLTLAFTMRPRRPQSSLS